MFDPAHLRSFVTVARTLSFTRAAGELGLQQSTVSQHVRKLEAVVGRELFVRDRHTVALTPDGETLLGFARSILGADERAVAHFARCGPAGVVRFGLAEGLADTAVPAAVAEYLDRHPAVRVELLVRPVDELDALLADGVLDVVLGELDGGPDLLAGQGKLAWRDELVWVGRPGPRPGRDGPVSLVLPAGPSPFTRRAIAGLRAGGRPGRTVATSSDVTGRWAAVRAGLGLTVHPRAQIPHDLAELPTGPPTGLPPLGEIDFVLRLAPRGAAALAEAFAEALLLHLPAARPRRREATLIGVPLPRRKGCVGG